ncbi:uncharacterized protein LOC127565606 isoform X1 [Drosophila albomicans]|uniref:Uncharacterized protein LOC127565606 isoform X1 n=1 Tax=Drosophila albomicans TaxID=7291 RepID=A0A9C6SX52_DROAB|nr:uncharacterized protein LOC127565606 isoform X1 [Drosophila albomicans]
MVNDSHRLHSRQVVGGFLDAEANGLLEEQQPPPQMPGVVDTEKEQKGQAIMEALLNLFTTKGNAVGRVTGATANSFQENQQPPPQMPVVVDTEKEQKGQAIMDALLTMFTTKVNEEEIKKDDSLSPEQLPTPTSPH